MKTKRTVQTESQKVSYCPCTECLRTHIYGFHLVITAIHNTRSFLAQGPITDAVPSARLCWRSTGYLNVWVGGFTHSSTQSTISVQPLSELAGRDLGGKVDDVATPPLTGCGQIVLRLACRTLQQVISCCPPPVSTISFNQKFFFLEICHSSSDPPEADVTATGALLADQGIKYVSHRQRDLAHESSSSSDTCGGSL